jgi:hypothetical protein
MDGTEDVILRYIIPAVTPVMILYKEGGGQGNLGSDEWRIEDGNTLSIDMKEEYMFGFSEDLNMEASATVTNKNDRSTATDDVMSGSENTGDDDTSDDDTTDDDIADDDTSDDDTSDDDTTDDGDITDLEDSDDSDDSPGFGIAVIVTAIIFISIFTIKRKIY